MRELSLHTKKKATKAPLKAELIVKLRSLQMEYEALEKETETLRLE